MARNTIQSLRARGYTADEAKFIIKYNWTPENFDKLRTGGLSSQEIMDMRAAGNGTAIFLKDPSLIAEARERGLLNDYKGLDFLEGTGYSFEDFELTGLDSLSDFWRLGSKAPGGFLNRMRGQEWTDYDRSRLENRLRYGGGLEGHTEELLDQESQAWRTNLERYDSTLQGLRDRLAESMGMLDTRSDQAEKDITTAYESQRGQALQGMVSSGMYNPSSVMSATRENAESREAAVNRQRDQDVANRINLYSTLQGDVLNYQGKPVGQEGLATLGPLAGLLQQQNAINAAGGGQSNSLLPFLMSIAGTGLGALTGGVGAGVGGAIGGSLGTSIAGGSYENGRYNSERSSLPNDMYADH